MDEYGLCAMPHFQTHEMLKYHRDMRDIKIVIDLYNTQNIWIVCVIMCGKYLAIK